MEDLLTKFDKTEAESVQRCSEDKRIGLFFYSTQSSGTPIYHTLRWSFVDNNTRLTSTSSGAVRSDISGYGSNLNGVSGSGPGGGVSSGVSGSGPGGGVSSGVSGSGPGGGVSSGVNGSGPGRDVSSGVSGSGGGGSGGSVRGVIIWYFVLLTLWNVVSRYHAE